jgi:hypothetical protein
MYISLSLNLFLLPLSCNLTLNLTSNLRLMTNFIKSITNYWISLIKWWLVKLRFLVSIWLWVYLCYFFIWFFYFLILYYVWFVLAFIVKNYLLHVYLSFQQTLVMFILCLSCPLWPLGNSINLITIQLKCRSLS